MAQFERSYKDLSSDGAFIVVGRLLSLAVYVSIIDFFFQWSAELVDKSAYGGGVSCHFLRTANLRYLIGLRD